MLNLPFVFTDNIGRAIETEGTWGWYVVPQTLDGHSVARVEWEEYCGDQAKGDHGFVRKSLDCIEIFVTFGAGEGGNGTVEHPLGRLPQKEDLSYYGCMTNCCLGVVFRCSGKCNQKDISVLGDKIIVDKLHGTFDALSLSIATNCDIEMNPDAPRWDNIAIGVFYNSMLRYNHHSGSNITSAVGCTLVSAYDRATLNVGCCKKCHVENDTKPRNNNQFGNELTFGVDTIALDTTINMKSNEKNFGSGNVVVAGSSLNVLGRGDLITCNINMIAVQNSKIPPSVINASKEVCGVYSVSVGASFNVGGGNVIGTKINCGYSGSPPSPTSGKGNCHIGGNAPDGGGINTTYAFHMSCVTLQDSAIKVATPPGAYTANGANGFWEGKHYYSCGFGGGLTLDGNLIPHNKKGLGGTYSGDKKTPGWDIFGDTLQELGGGTIGFRIGNKEIVKAAPDYRIMRRYPIEGEPYEERLEYANRTITYELPDYIHAEEIINSNISICE